MELEGTASLDPDLQGYLGLGVILGTGLAMGGFATYHALTAEVEPVSALYVLTPICFNVGLVAAGYQFWRTRFGGPDILRIAGWVFVGIVVFGLLVTWTVTHQYFRGGSFAHPGFVTVNNMSFGGLMGVVIGWLDASNRRYERQLEAETAKLNRQNDRLEEFASIVSHDLRNPLNVAKLHLRTAREQTDHDSLSTVESSLARMEEIVDDVLTMAHQEEVEETEHVTLRTAATRSWRTVRSDTAELEVVDDLAFEADPTLLGHVLENLFGNAIEHGTTDGTGGDGPGVTVRVGALEDGFYVEDDGPGIPEAHRDRLFEAGYSTDEGGTGFGLSIVERMVAAHGWTIRATEARHGDAPGSSPAANGDTAASPAANGGTAGARFEITGVQRAGRDPTDVIDETWESVTRDR